MRSRLTVRMAVVWLVLVMRGADLWAAAPIKLNGPLVGGGNVFSFKISPDSSRMLYRADQDTNDLIEVYSVAATGGTPVKLNGPLVAVGDVSFELFSPDSSRVVYVADQETDNLIELYSVPAGGGTPVKLNGPLVAGGDVFSTSPLFISDGSRVLYLADQDTDTVTELYSVPAGGGAVVKLNGPLVANGDVFSPLSSPDGSRVLYMADQDTNDVDELYIVPASGGTPVKLNGALVAGGDVSSSGLAFSPDGSRVLYMADQDTDSVAEIYSVPTAGGTPVKLNGPLVAGGDVFNIFGELQFSPDGSRVLYYADQDTNDVGEIYSVPAAGGTPVKLNGPLVAGGSVSPSGQQFSPDSSRVLYVADQITDGAEELFIVPATGGTPIKLNSPLVAGGNVVDALFSSDSSRVVYLADQDTDDVLELYSVPALGGTPIKLNGALAAGGDVNLFKFSPDGSRILYKADQDTNDDSEIYLVPASGGTPVKLNGPLVAGGDVSQSFLQFSPDGSLVLYFADQDTDTVNEIYVRIVRQHSVGGAGDWDTVATWDHGGEPDEVMQVFVDAPGTVTVSGGASRTVNELIVGGGAGTATLALADGAGVTAMHGATIKAGGVLRGNGQLVADVAVAAGGEIRAAAAERLVVSGASVSNAGRIEAIGTPSALAEIEFDGAVTNSAGTGSIVARNAILRFDGGLVNDSAVALSFGTSDVLGDVTNSATGTIAVAGNSGVTFYDDVTNSGTLNVAGGSTAVFFGTLAGNGNVGSGDVQALGDLLPGASPGTMAFGGDLTLGPLTNLEIEIGGLAAGSGFDQLVVTGDAALAGALHVLLIDGFTLSLGDSFEIVDINGARNGAFSGLAEGAAVGSFGGKQLLITYAGGDGNDVALYVPGLPGDFNFDGTVDAADYVVWRKTDGTQEGYDTWRANFGATAGSGGGDAASANLPTVPEPASMVLTVLASLVVGQVHRRRISSEKSSRPA